MKALLKKRGIDAWGNGAFGATRIGSNGKVKSHKGIDYACPPNIGIMSPAIGEVTKLGYPYPYVSKGTNFRYVEISDLAGLRHQIYYVKPSVKEGDQVTILTVIGQSQDIAKKYDTKVKKMVNHIHYQVLDTDGVPIDPETIGHD